MQHSYHKENHEIKSPCKGVCTLDMKGKCVGCFRTLDEIANWCSYTDEERKKVLKLVELRMQLPEYFD
jgi:predicted Fe-S protein YdhL (DUF1289 family)